MVRLCWKILIVVLVVGNLLACEKSQVSYSPETLTRQHTCALDGMIVADYKGPKGQIVWKDGSRSFYCDVREAMFSWVNPVEQNRIAKLYVQDFSGVEWGAHKDRWVEAASVSFVIDSQQKGAMGVSYVPFSVTADAAAFQQQFGGKIVALDAINEQTLAVSGALQQQRLQHKQHH